MKILYNHFDNKTTYIVGNYIINGCQTFHKDDAESVFDLFKVPQEMRDEVLSYCSDSEDWNKLAEHEDINVRAAVARQGFALDKLVNDLDHLVRVTVAKQGYALDKLINDEHYYVRQIAETQLTLKNNEN